MIHRLLHSQSIKGCVIDRYTIHMDTTYIEYILTRLRSQRSSDTTNSMELILGVPEVCEVKRFIKHKIRFILRQKYRRWQSLGPKISKLKLSSASSSRGKSGGNRYMRQTSVVLFSILFLRTNHCL